MSLNFKMMKLVTLPLVDWTMGIVVIGVFALVCIAMVLIVMNMMQSKSGKDQQHD